MTKAYLSLDDLKLQGKTVLLRADLNVPFKDGKVTDATRLERLGPTLRDLRAQGAKIAILSHFGRPDGQPNPKYSLAPIAKALGETLKLSVAFAPACIGDQAQSAIAALPVGGIVVLENTRFHAEEEANDPGFAKALAALGDVFISDAFSAAHRAHASTAGIAAYLPSAAGRLMEAELDALTAALESPRRPVAAIVGGAKISTKLAVLENLAGRVDVLVLGGGMANTFLAAKGVKMGKSLVEAEMLDKARQIMTTAGARGCSIVLPTDATVAKEFKADAPHRHTPIASIAEDEMMLDLGPASSATIMAALEPCRTILWNGPLGVFEMPPFDRATKELAMQVARLTQQNGVVSVAGGGETVAALVATGQTEQLSYVSTAGGAFLEWLEGKELPGVAALKTARRAA